MLGVLEEDKETGDFRDKAALLDSILGFDVKCDRSPSES